MWAATSSGPFSLNPPIGRAGGGDVGVSELWGAAGGGFLWVREVPWGFGRFVGAFGAWRDERNLWETFSYGLFAGEWAGSAELRQAADTGES